VARPSELRRGDIWTVNFGAAIGQHSALLVARTGSMRCRSRVRRRHNDCPGSGLLEPGEAVGVGSHSRVEKIVVVAVDLVEERRLLNSSVSAGCRGSNCWPGLSAPPVRHGVNARTRERCRSSRLEDYVNRHTSVTVPGP
jgi:hypothetical protein